jgi:hypothetical protein
MHLPHGQERTGRVIKHVSGQGPIYLRALEDLSDENVSTIKEIYCGRLTGFSHEILLHLLYAIYGNNF